jgi:hypothetical protein
MDWDETQGVDENGNPTELKCDWRVSWNYKNPGTLTKGMMKQSAMIPSSALKIVE